MFARSTHWYSGNLVIVNSGAAPVSGKVVERRAWPRDVLEPGQVLAELEMVREEA